MLRIATYDLTNCYQKRKRKVHVAATIGLTLVTDPSFASYGVHSSGSYTISPFAPFDRATVLSSLPLSPTASPIQLASLSMSYPVASAPFDSSVETTFTTMPHPEWTYGQKTETLGEDGAAWVKGEEAGWKLVDTSKIEPA